MAAATNGEAEDSCGRRDRILAAAAAGIAIFVLCATILLLWSNDRVDSSAELLLRYLVGLPLCEQHKDLATT
jgi:hypothetical protein